MNPLPHTDFRLHTTTSDCVAAVKGLAGVQPTVQSVSSVSVQRSREIVLDRYRACGNDVSLLAKADSGCKYLIAENLQYIYFLNKY